MPKNDIFIFDIFDINDILILFSGIFIFVFRCIYSCICICIYLDVFIFIYIYIYTYLGVKKLVNYLRTKSKLPQFGFVNTG